MKKRQKQVLALTVIILLAIAGGFFVYPKGWGAKHRPWRLGLDLVGGSHLVYRVDLSQTPAGDRDSVLAGLRDVIEQRVNLFGVAEPQVYVAKSGNENDLVVDLAGVKNISDAIGQIGATPFLDFRTIEQTAKITTSSTPEVSVTFAPTGLTGRYLVNAELGFEQTTNAPQINFTLNDEGAKLFQEITRKLAPTIAGGSDGKPLCVFVDGQPIIPDSPQTSCPRVNGEIAGGKAVITGTFSLDLAKQIVARFNAGALPAQITLINQQTVSPTLGQDSVRKAIFAGIIGTLLVILFMVVYYRSLGIFAAMALVIYIALTLSIFKLIPITLTLAGLAGFILTIGMAVDANILVFERVKEEMRKGLSRGAAMHEGFRHAWPSIRDSNTSTIITAVILYFFTSSFVQGFALTLFIGVVISMFSAITTTRLLLDLFAKDRSKTAVKTAA